MFELDTIVVGDCLDIVTEMPDECVDAVVTDPPYQVGLNKQLCSWDIWPGSEIWKQLYRVVKKDGYLVLSLAPHISHERIPDVLGTGWRVLHIRSNNKLPTKDQLNIAMAQLQSGKDRAEIVLDDWGHGPIFTGFT